MLHFEQAVKARRPIGMLVTGRCQWWGRDVPCLVGEVEICLAVVKKELILDLISALTGE